MTKTTATAEARKRAQAKVAEIKQRVARQHGMAEPDAHAGEDADTVRQKAQVTRTQSHPAARTQRTQGRREGK